MELGLNAFVQKASQMLQQEDIDGFISLMLAGRIVHIGREHRVFVNPLRGLPVPDPDDLTLAGDFDSLLGFTKQLPLRVPLSVTPVPSFKSTLKNRCTFLSPSK